MAKVYGPISREVYGPLKGIVDFYYHKGQLCARGYPERCKQPHTPGAVQNWVAQRAKWADSKLLTENDKNGYRTVTGGSQLSWIDLYSKVYLKGYHVQKVRPPVVYGVSFAWIAGQLRLCYRATMDCSGVVCYEDDWDGLKKKPWKWMFEMPSPPPPNCTQKYKIAYNFSQAVDVSLKENADGECVNIEKERYGYGRWLMLVIKGGKNEDVLFRTGAWYVANRR